MRHAILLLTLSAAAFGCGKSKPSSGEQPNTPNTPLAGDPKASVGSPGTDPNAGKPKDAVKVLAPRAVIKTGYQRKPASQDALFLTEDGKRAAVSLGDVQKIQIWDIGGEPTKLKEFP